MVRYGVTAIKDTGVRGRRPQRVSGAAVRSWSGSRPGLQVPGPWQEQPAEEAGLGAAFSRVVLPRRAPGGLPPALPGWAAEQRRFPGAARRFRAFQSLLRHDGR